MTNNAQIKLWFVIGSAGLAGLTLAIALPAFKRNKIRNNLDDALNNPMSSGAIGGIESLQASAAFDTKRYLKSNKATISRTDALERAKKVWKNYGSWYSSDDESAIVNAFDGLGHYDDLSKIADYFQQQYDHDLFSVLQDALQGDKKETQLLIGKIQALPKN